MALATLASAWPGAASVPAKVMRRPLRRRRVRRHCGELAGQHGVGRCLGGSDVRLPERVDLQQHAEKRHGVLPAHELSSDVVAVGQHEFEHRRHLGESGYPLGETLVALEPHDDDRAVGTVADGQVV